MEVKGEECTIKGTEQSEFTVGGFGFGVAVEIVKQGEIALRIPWIPKAEFIFMRPKDKLPIDVIEKVKSLPESIKKILIENGKDVEFDEYLCLINSDGNVVNGWIPTVEDMLATDWISPDEIM